MGNDRDQAGILPLEWSEDAFLGGAVTLRQRRKGHRAGTDAVLLAANVARNTEGYVVDAGAASGAVGLMAAARAPFISVDLIEIDPAECGLALHNIAANRLEARCRVIEADLLAPEAERERAGLAKESANLVLSNPPFLRADAARLSPDPDRARAHAMPQDGLERWCRTLAWLTAPDGQLVLIHRADALADLLKALEGRFGALTIRPILPRADQNASRILVTGRKGSRAALTLQPGFVLHRADGEFTDEAAALHAGEYVW